MRMATTMDDANPTRQKPTSMTLDMAPILTRKRSLNDIQTPEERVPPTEFNDVEYHREVLHLADGETETILEATLQALATELGITVPQPALSKQISNPAHHSMCESALTVTTRHARTASTASRETKSTGITSRSSHDGLRDSTPRRHHVERRLSFTEYEKFIHEAEAKAFLAAGVVAPPVPPSDHAPSLFSVSTRKSYQSIRSNLTKRFKLKKNRASKEEPKSCGCCRDEFKTLNALHSLSCGHTYCDTCLRVLVNQAATDEGKMPPRCCSKPIPSNLVKAVLTAEDQQIFMKSVLQFRTPWEARIFCPNPSCEEFIPKPDKIDPRHPFEYTCLQCDTKVCSTCKRPAHAFGQDCPMDWELNAAVQQAGKAGWKRCYNCRTLAEGAQNSDHITCRCKAQFCFICGAVWDVSMGCPNYCSKEEELERRRIEEETRAAILAAERAAREEADKLETVAKLEAERRTAESEELNDLRATQTEERDRFVAFERKMKWLLWTRHGQAKLDVLDKYGELVTKMRDRHARTATHLEDRQVGAEMELRASLKQAERSVQIRLRHMEAYCDGLGRATHGPPRVVTERDLRELGQQYNVRDDLERLHQSKINVMRDKQAKQMEQLLARQLEEEEKLIAKQDLELDALESSFTSEETQFVQTFKGRRERLLQRWGLAEEIGRKKLQQRTSLRYAPMALPEWPEPKETQEAILEVVTE